MLRAEADGKADDAGAGEDRSQVDADLSRDTSAATNQINPALIVQRTLIRVLILFAAEPGSVSLAADARARATQAVERRATRSGHRRRRSGRSEQRPG
jgi:hypothetical protein